MNNTYIIEQSWSSATSIQFHATDNYDTNPPIVGLLVDDLKSALNGYNILTDNYTNKDTTLVIKNNGDKLDISIVNKLTADAINIKNLNFDKTQLADFFKKEPSDRKFVFAIGHLNEVGRFTFASSRPKFVPFWVDKYHVVK